MVGGDDGESSIFSGVEDTDHHPQGRPGDQLDETAPVAPVGSALDPVAIAGRFVDDLTYREVHAFLWGFVPWFLALAAESALLFTGAILVTASIIGFLRVPNGKATSIVREPHYGLAGALLGWLSGATVLALVRIMAAFGGLVG